MEAKRSLKPSGKKAKRTYDYSIEISKMNDAIFELQTQKKESEKKYVDELRKRLASDSKITQLTEEVYHLQEENKNLMMNTIMEDIKTVVSHQHQMEEMFTEVQSLDDIKEQLTQELQDCKISKEQLSQELQESKNGKEQLSQELRDYLQELLDVNYCKEQLLRELDECKKELADIQLENERLLKKKAGLAAAGGDDGESGTRLSCERHLEAERKQLEEKYGHMKQSKQSFLSKAMDTMNLIPRIY